MAAEDLERLKEDLEQMQEDIIDEILPMEEIDTKNVTIEVRQAAGGSESSLFAEDIANMYKGFCQGRGWRFIEEDYQTDFQIGKGCKLGVFKIIGENVYYWMKHESGVHK